MALNQDSSIVSQIRDVHHQYRQTHDPDEKRHFYSDDCRQICRQDYSYAARDPDRIVRYVKESQPLINRVLREAGVLDDDSGSLPVTASYYTIRPLTEAEADEFGESADLVAGAGFSSIDELRDRAKKEGWKGMRVNLWTDDSSGRGLLVKVKYWWRLEDCGEGVWRQIFHDILYIGVRDGTEKNAGGEVIQDVLS